MNGPLELTMQGFVLMTAQIWYYLPDHPHLVNPNWFLWRAHDRVPHFPRLNAYLDWWQANLDGKLAGVRVWASGLLAPTDLKHLGGVFRL